MSNGSASSPTVASPDSSRSRICRRAGCAIAWNTSLALMRRSISKQMLTCQALRFSPSPSRGTAPELLTQDGAVELQLLGDQARDEEILADVVAAASGDDARLGGIVEDAEGVPGSLLRRVDEEAADARLNLQGNTASPTADHRRG